MGKNNKPTSTDFESNALCAPVNLADGHASQELPDGAQHVFHALNRLFTESEAQTEAAIVGRYKSAWAKLIGSPCLDRIVDHHIFPTASNSIELVANYLAAHSKRVGLIEPTFDNLSLILRRRNLPVVSVAESLLRRARDVKTLEDALRGVSIDALFIVSPNNPTGTCLDAVQFASIIEYCLRNSVTLICDNSFRLFARNPFDDYEMLVDSGVSFICFEDTGKVFPTQELKASLLTCSADNREVVQRIYREVYLRDSPFKLALLTELASEAEKIGLNRFVHGLVDERRTRLRRILAGSTLKVAAAAEHSATSVEWLCCRDTGKTDMETYEELERRGLIVLPGRNFFWNATLSPENHHNIRISLLKPTPVFDRGMQILAEYCSSSSKPSCWA
jgi:aspartate/methionine/tyrosine aminotransferase